MSGHRRSSASRRGYLPPGWVVIVAFAVCVGAASWLAVLALTAPDDSVSSDEPTATAPTATATTPEPTPEPTPTETTPAEPQVERTATVSVLNNTGIRGLAARYSGEVRAKGWTIGGIGDWNGQIEANTVYYPPQLQEQAEVLAQDMGITRTRPSFAPMRNDRLTIILSGPQQ